MAGHSVQDLGLISNLDALAVKIKEQKTKQKLARLSPFWAKRQEEKANRPVVAKAKRTDGVDMSELQNLRELTKTVKSMERARTAHLYTKTATFRNKPRWDERQKRSLDGGGGGLRSFKYRSDKNVPLSMAPRVLKFPLQGQGANKYYEGCSTHTKWADDSKPAKVLRELWNVPFGSKKPRLMPLDVSKIPLSHDLSGGGIIAMDKDAIDEEELKKTYKLSRRARNQLKRKELANRKLAKKRSLLESKSCTAAFKDKVKRDPYGLIPFGDGMSDFRQPGPGPATDSASADRLSLYKELSKKIGGKFKGGSRATMPIVGQDAPKIWSQPNTLDDVPLESITKPQEGVPMIAKIDTKLKAHDYPECIMVEKQGGDNLFSAHKPWGSRPKEAHEKKGAELHFAFGSYRGRFPYDMQPTQGAPTSEMTSPVPSSFEIKDPKRTSMVFRCTEKREIFGKQKTKKSVLVLEKHGLLDHWNVH